MLITQLVEDLKNKLANQSEYEENLKKIDTLGQKFCAGNQVLVD